MLRKKNLDEWLEYYNNASTHQGKTCCGRMSLAMLTMGKPLGMINDEDEFNLTGTSTKLVTVRLSLNWYNCIHRLFNVNLVQIMINNNNIKKLFLFFTLFYSALTFGQSTLPPSLFTANSQQIPLVISYKSGTYGYIVQSGIPKTNADSSANNYLSTMRLFEIWPDGSTKELGPGHSLLNNIRNLGKGRFSHWKDSKNIVYLLFSSSDATDPRTNGRSYLAVIPSAVSSSDKVGSIHESQTNTRKYYLGTSDPKHRTIVISNPASYAYRFGLAFNQNGFIQSLANLKTEVQNQIPDFSGETIENKVWRFARDNRVHRVPYSGAAWYHHPLMLFNSSGFGFCDDVASAIVHTAALFGIPGRVWALESPQLGGHIVSELYTNGSWHLYDADFQTYFINSSTTNQVASVSELASKSALITSPIKSLASTSVNSSLVWNSALYSTLYNSAAYLVPWYTVLSMSESPLRFDLPPGGAIEIGGHGASDAPTTLLSGVWSRETTYSSVKVKLPQGSVGNLQVFLIPYMIKGNGSVTFTFQDDYVWTIPISSTTNWNINDLRFRNSYIKKISYTVGTGGMEVYYLANPIRASVKAFNSVVLKPDATMPSALANPLAVKFMPHP